MAFDLKDSGAVVDTSAGDDGIVMAAPSINSPRPAPYKWSALWDYIQSKAGTTVGYDVGTDEGDIPLLGPGGKLSHAQMNLASVPLTGTPTAPTASPGTNSQQIATMAAVEALLNGAEATVASATTCDIGAATSTRVHVSGTTTVTSFGSVANKVRVLRFSGALTLTHNGTSLILPSATNITTAAGDTAIFGSDGSGNWRCVSYQRADGSPLTGTTLASQEEARSGTNNTKVMTPLRVKEASGLWLLAEITASNAATLDIEGHFTSNYDRYVIELDGITFATDDVYLLARVGTGGTPTYQSTSYVWTNCWPGVSTTTMVLDNSTNFGLSSSICLTATATGNRPGNAAGESLSGRIEISNPDATQKPIIRADVWYNRSSEGHSVGVLTNGSYDVSGAITALRLFASAGNISGKARIYGVRAT